METVERPKLDGLIYDNGDTEIRKIMSNLTWEKPKYYNCKTTSISEARMRTLFDSAQLILSRREAGEGTRKSD